MRPIVLILLVACSVAAAAADRLARELFSSRGPAVVQIRVVDSASGDKSSVGSGFQVDASGLLVTNFHVVAEFAHAPRRFRLEYLDAAGERVPLELLDVDVVHDLALLRTPAPLVATLALAPGAPVQGERLYSLGNPLDLAMTIVEGTYNGYVDAARFRQMLFSASLNPGMSGGPALNEAGEVVGVNVAHAGEQISFLVPVEFVVALLERRADERWQALPIRQRIAASLLAEQDAYFARLLAGSWPTQRFGGFMVPGRISATLKCWGGSSDREESRFDHAVQECSSQDGIYVEEGLETGSLSYAFQYFANRGLGQIAFYGLLGAHYAHGRPANASNERQVGNFRCREDFVRANALDWRVSFCARRYERMAGLFDISVAMATSELDGDGLVATLGVSGISEARALQFTRRFLESLAWTH